MFSIHTKDGRTIKIDLSDERQARDFLNQFKHPDFQGSVTGITVLQSCGGRFKCPACNRSNRLVCSHCGRQEGSAECDKTIQYSVSRPDGFGQMFFHTESLGNDPDGPMKGGEQVTCFVDDVRLVMLVHKERPSTRVTLSKTGKQRYNPLVD